MDKEPTPTPDPDPRIAIPIIAILTALIAVLLTVFSTADRTGTPDEPTTTTTTAAPVLNEPMTSLDNPSGMSNFRDGDAPLTADEINNAATGPYDGFHSNAWTQPAPRPDNGAHVQGQFRINCAVSHYAYDDPIIHPGQPSRSHLHMFWGNTAADHNSTPATFAETGGSTCQGGVLNRSAYWIPAMLDGPTGPDRSVVIPKTITLYYKSHRPADVNPLPAGIQLLVGNVDNGGAVRPSIPAGRPHLSWGCYNPARGQAVNLAPVIPGTADTPQCPNNWDIQASIEFPQCIATNGGAPVLTSPGYVAHTARLGSDSPHGPQTNPCPASHPYRVPQISYLIRWANPAGTTESTWRLSSDTDADKASPPHPGGSLHGDWVGAWNDQAQQAWIDGCFLNAPRNCSGGQTGQNDTGRQFRPIIGDRLRLQHYTGPHVVADPCPTCDPQP